MFLILCVSLRHVCFTIVLFLSSFSGYAKEVRGVTDDTINMGLMIDLSGAAANAYPIYNAIKTYYKYVNDSGGINGRKVKMVVEDDRYLVPAAMAAFKKLVFRDKVLYLQGPSGSSQMVALMGQAEKEKIPIISVTTGDKIVEPFKRYNFTMVSLYSDQQAVVFNYLMNDLKLKDPRIAFVYPDNEYGKTARDAARESAKRYGIKLVTEEVLNVGDVDATSIIMNLKRAKPDYVINQGVMINVVTFFKDSRKYRFKTNYIGCYAACTEEAIKILEGSDITYYGNSCYSSWYEDVPGIARMRDITLKYHPGTEKQWIKEYSKMYATGWLLSSIYVEGLKMAGRDLNAETLVDALETFREVDFGGISGPVTYTSKSHNANSYSRMYKADIDKGIFIPLTGWRKP
ncbi:MAG: ABC transporter substrate-binding protein [Deltaproteobacteria bacterium]|nr:MAG: ABC transporter substrate-binding protein [Deltaproteobacteria bacterium]